jgi:hypothetical protein
MIPPFDIFRIAQDNQPLWVEPASTLEDARARVVELGELYPGEYFIFSQQTGHRIAMTVGSPEKPLK